MGELLGRQAKLIVPRFQRPYSWEKKHVEIFWNDIIGHHKKNDNDRYFLGPIVVLIKSNDVIEILDGQQRLATATILFSVLRDVGRSLQTLGAQNFASHIQDQLILQEDTETDVFSLEMGEMDNLYFKDTIQTFADPPPTKKPTVRSHRNIQKARQVLQDSVKAQIAGLDPPLALSNLKKLQKTFRNLVMACIPVNSEEQAFQIFETLNDRGLRLSVPDLLLNYLMRESGETDRAQIRQYWNEMLTQIGTRDINRFLRHMWVSKYGDLKTEDLFTALKKHIVSKSVNCLEFTRMCSDECEHYVQLIEADADALKDAAPHVHSLLRGLDIQAALPLLLSCHGRLEPTDLTKVVRWLLVFVTRYSVVVNLDPSGLETVLFTLAREVRNKLARKETSQNCVKHIKDALVKNAPADDQVKRSAETLFVSPDDAKYLLGRLALHMESATKELRPNEVNVEHIFPKNPGNECRIRKNWILIFGTSAT